MSTLRLVALSDTHLRHIRHEIKVPPGDILIHAGDAMLEGTELEARAFFNWFGELPHRRKVYVAGNHDVIFQKNPTLARKLVPRGVDYLEDSEVSIDGLRIYGSPWQPEFCDWAFNLPRGDALRSKWNLIPDGIDILVTHGPPMGVLDMNMEGEHVGCQDLRKAVNRVKPRLHIFGHIHCGHGQVTWDGTHFINAAICDERYGPSYPSTVMDLEARKGL